MIFLIFLIIIKKIELLDEYLSDLRDIFIVSGVSVVKDQAFQNAFDSEILPGFSILVKKSTNAKCERCWVHDDSVGTIDDHPKICSRCCEQLEKSDDGSD